MRIFLPVVESCCGIVFTQAGSCASHVTSSSREKFEFGGMLDNFAGLKILVLSMKLSSEQTDSINPASNRA